MLLSVHAATFSCVHPHWLLSGPRPGLLPQNTSLFLCHLQFRSEPPAAGPGAAALKSWVPPGSFQLKLILFPVGFRLQGEFRLHVLKLPKRNSGFWSPGPVVMSTISPGLGVAVIRPLEA